MDNKTLLTQALILYFHNNRRSELVYNTIKFLVAMIRIEKFLSNRINGARYEAMS